ncbi:MAG: hypothetical protein IJY01_00510 [Clostridia bacterium]|nr:hypothetical protein [Clostridia bacterium]
MKGRFDFEGLFIALEILAAFAKLFAFAIVGVTCLLLPIVLAKNISWWYLFLYLVTIPIFVGIILFLCYTKEEDRND